MSKPKAIKAILCDCMVGNCIGFSEQEGFCNCKHGVGDYKITHGYFLPAPEYHAMKANERAARELLIAINGREIVDMFNAHKKLGRTFVNLDKVRSKG